MTTFFHLSTKSRSFISEKIGLCVANGDIFAICAAMKEKRTDTPARSPKLVFKASLAWSRIDDLELSHTRRLPLILSMNDLSTRKLRLIMALLHALRIVCLKWKASSAIHKKTCLHQLSTHHRRRENSTSLQY